MSDVGENTILNEPGTFDWTRKILTKFDLKARKQWGQNFLVDRHILNNIVAGAEIQPDDTVIEIGTGLGALAIELATQAKQVITIEIDQRLEAVHRQVFAPYPNIKKVQADILKVDLEELIVFETGESGPFKVCANLPYYITSPILFVLLEQCPSLELAVLMMQREVAQRLMAAPGSSDYGILTVMANYYARFSTVCQVGHDCFYPKPEVDSTVIKLVPIPDSERVEVGDVKAFRRLVKAGFNQRRKMLTNTLAAGFSLPKEDIRERLGLAGIDGTLRPEQLGLLDWARLTQYFL